MKSIHTIAPVIGPVMFLKKVFYENSLKKKMQAERLFIQQNRVYTIGELTIIFQKVLQQFHTFFLLSVMRI